jgi:dipeptidyl aminopeptidase/acylaminoacyl peptidase
MATRCRLNQSKIMRFSTLFVLLPIFAAAAASEPSGKRAVRPDDYNRVAAVSDPHLSPDGKYVAYVVSTTNIRLNRRESAIWIAAVDGIESPRQFTTDASSSSPRWSPDGRTIAFLSARSDAGAPAGPPPKPQIYVLRLDGGESRRMGSLPDGVSAFEWSPDGKHVACVSRPALTGSSGDKSDFKAYRGAAIKLNGAGYFDGRRTRIFVMDAATGEAHALTSDPSRNDSEPRWSPDGSTIAFASSDLDQSLFESTDIFTVPSSGGSPVRISEPRVDCKQPRWSPDGNRVAYLATVTDAGTPRIWVAPASGKGKSVLAAAGLSLVPGQYEWTETGNAIDASLAVRGEHQIYRMDLAARKFAPLTSGPHAIVGFDSGKHVARTVFLSNDSTHPGELFTGDDRFGNARQLTHHNDALLEKVEFQPVERINYKSVDGIPIDGFLIKPFGWQAGRTYPMVVSVHGGPNGMYGVAWSDELQIYAANGYAVFCTNPRGSSGYGEEFQRLVDREWGGKAYQDILNGVDAILTKYPWIDRERLGVRGLSYGGFMTNWIVGHTHMFKAACALSSISDFVSVEGDRDGYYGHARDFGGDLFENFDYYWKLSPLHYASAVKTPTLILHGDADQRVPLEQGEEWFRALLHFHVPTELVVFPREDHALHHEPRHVIDIMNWQLYWFDRYLNGNQAAVRPIAN